MKNEMIFFERDLISEIFKGVENPFDELAGKMKNKLVKSLSALSDQEYLVLSLFHEEEITSKNKKKIKVFQNNVEKVRKYFFAGRQSGFS